MDFIKSSFLSIKNQFRFSPLFLRLFPYLNSKRDRLFVKFNGLSQHTFQIYCYRRQLHWFQRFLENQEIKFERLFLSSCTAQGLKSLLGIGCGFSKDSLLWKLVAEMNLLPLYRAGAC